MAIKEGFGPHKAWVSVDGTKFPLLSGSVELSSTRESSSFSGTLAYGYQGAVKAFGDVTDQSDVQIIVETRGVTGDLIIGGIDVVTMDLIARTISFQGRDKSADLHDKKTSEKFVDQGGDEIAPQLGKEAGVEVEASGSKEKAGKQVRDNKPVKLTDNVSTAYAIHKLAEFDGARWYTDKQGKVHYEVIGGGEGGTYTINYKDGKPFSSDATALCIKHNVQAGANIKMEAISHNTKDKTVYRSTSMVKGKGGTKHYKLHIPGLRQKSVAQHAHARAGEIAKHEYTVDVTVVGDPSITIDMKLQLKGTPADQTLEIDSIIHTIGMQGHTMSITARSMAENRSAIDNYIDPGPGTGESAPAQAQ